MLNKMWRIRRKAALGTDRLTPAELACAGGLGGDLKPLLVSASMAIGLLSAIAWYAFNLDAYLLPTLPGVMLCMGFCLLTRRYF